MGIAIKSVGSRKGIILTIDSIVAITLVAIILITATNYIALSQEDILPELQLVRTGSDILTLLDNLDYFNGMNMTKLRENLDELLPPSYEMKINLTIDGESNVTDSQDRPLDRFIGTGERVFVINDGNIKFGIARFWIWSKN